MVRKFRRKTTRRIRRRAGGKSRRRAGGKSRRRVGGKSRRRAGGKSRRRGGENSSMNQQIKPEEQVTIDSTGDDPLKNISIDNISNEEIRKLLDMENPTFKETPEFQKGIKVKLNKDSIENDMELISILDKTRRGREMPLIEKLNKMAGLMLVGTDGKDGLIYWDTDLDTEFKIIERYPQTKLGRESTHFSDITLYIIEGKFFETSQYWIKQERPNKLVVPENWLVKV